MFTALLQIAAMWLASSLVVGIAVGKLLKRSNEAALEHVALQPSVTRQQPITTHAKAG